MGKLLELFLLCVFVIAFAYYGLFSWVYYHEDSHVAIDKLYGFDYTVVFSNFGLVGKVISVGDSMELKLAHSVVEANYSDKAICVGVWMIFGVLFFLACQKICRVC